jgi:hypothetical protein
MEDVVRLIEARENVRSGALIGLLLQFKVSHYPFFDNALA